MHAMVVAISPSGAMIASLVPLSLPPHHHHPPSPGMEDVMVGIAIQPSVPQTSSLSSLLSSSPPPQMIRVPSMSSYILASSTSTATTSTTSTAAATSETNPRYSVRCRQLMWLGGTTSSTTTGTSSSDTPFIGLITTLQPQQGTTPSTNPSRSASASASRSANPTFLTVIDRTRGIPIYTMQCHPQNADNDQGEEEEEEDATTTPTIIHDATGATSVSTGSKRNNKKNHRHRNSAGTTTGGTTSTCIGIFQPQSSSSSSSSSSSIPSPYFYIAMARDVRDVGNRDDATNPTGTNSDSPTQPRRKVSVLLYECRIQNGKIVRKIKLGHGHCRRNTKPLGTGDFDSIHQPWLSIMNVPSPNAISTTTPVTSIVTYLLDHATTTGSTGTGSSHPSSGSLDDGNIQSDQWNTMLRGMNLSDGTKLYKVKLPATTPTRSHSPVHSTAVPVAIQSSTLAALSISVIIDANGMVQLFDSRTGHWIESQLPNKDGIVVTDAGTSNRGCDSDSSFVRLQVILTKLPPPPPPSEDVVVPVTTPSKKTKKKKELSTATSTSLSNTALSPQYCVWILINEQILLPILLQRRLVESEHNVSSDGTTPTSEYRYGYTVQQPYRIASSSTTDDHKMMRCFLIHPNNSNITTNHPLPPQLMVFQQSHSPVTKSSTNAIAIQIISLLSPDNMDVGSDNVIRIDFEESTEDNNNTIKTDHDHPADRMSIEADGVHDDMDNNDNDNGGDDGGDDGGNRDVSVSETTAKKRKQQSLTNVVLGPGQSGGEARHVTEGHDNDHHTIKNNNSDSNKRMKRPSEDEKGDNSHDTESDHEPTIAERLRLLQQALDAEDDDDGDDDPMDDNNNNNNNNNKNDDDGGDDTDGRRATKKDNDSKFVVKYATTESLTQLLVQALQSSDGTMMEQAFQVRDKYILRATCQALTTDQVLVLFDALIQRLASKPSRTEQLVAWVSAILQSNQITNVQHLQPLQNLLSERLEVFPLLLQLEGRLENMIGM